MCPRKILGVDEAEYEVIAFQLHPGFIRNFLVLGIAHTRKNCDYDYNERYLPHNNDLFTIE